MKGPVIQFAMPPIKFKSIKRLFDILFERSIMIEIYINVMVDGHFWQIFVLKSSFIRAVSYFHLNIDFLSNFLIKFNARLGVFHR